MKKKYRALLTAGLLGLLLPNQSISATVTGGDAVDMASADVLLDIAFVIDTSGSMADEASQINTTMGNIINNLDCPECNVWVRADFYGIDGTWGGLFNEDMDNITGNTADTITNHSEDNAPAVTDMINFYSYWGNDDSTVTQDYYKAIVTIGDEGTEDGYEPSGVDQADWDAAFVANQLAISNDFMIFSLTGTPWSSYSWDELNRDKIFEAMAIGGIGGGHTFGNTGGTFAKTTSSTLELDIEYIICTAAGGGNEIPEPATMLLFGTGLAGLVGSRLRRNKK